MPFTGGFVQGLWRTGGARPTVQIILDSLNEQMGSAYDTSGTSPRYMMNLAIAKAIADVWNTGERMKNQIDPDRMSEFLPRWERIMGMTPIPGEPLRTRNKRVKARYTRFGRQPTRQAITDLLYEELYPIEVTLYSDDDTTAIIGWPYTMGKVYSLGTTPPVMTVIGDPEGTERLRVKIVVLGTLGVAEFQWSFDDGGTYSANVLTAASYPIPGSTLTLQFSAGTYATDNVWYARAYTDDDWFSSVAKVSVQCSAPSGMPDSEFYPRIGQAWVLMDDFSPVWLDFQFSRDSIFGTGFFLDTEHNLDNQRFRI